MAAKPTVGTGSCWRTKARAVTAAGVVALVMVAWACVVAGQAQAQSLPPYPGISFPSGAFNSRCASISLSGGPTVVQVGGKISASAGPRTDQCGGPADQVSYSWGLSELGTVVSGCGTNASRCVVRVAVPTTAWKQACITGSAPFGGWSSCGLVFVLNHKYEVSGRTTVQGSSGAPAAGVRIRAGCGDGGTTRTDASGDYNFLLSPGSCTIAPAVSGGEKADPRARVVTVGNRDVSGVDFRVSCGSAGGADCPLKVFVKPLEQLRSGLAVHSIHYSQAPVDFLAAQAGAAFKGESFQCESGCVDLTVSVIDPKTHQAPSPGASVDASVGDIHLGKQVIDARVSTPPAFGKGFLCEVGSDGNDAQCGSSITGLQTDGDGQVHLRYWTPGVIASADTELTVTARCDASPCTATPKTSHTTLKVKPYLAFQHHEALSPSHVRELAEWAGGASGFNKLVETNNDAYDVLLRSLKLLKKLEIGAQQVEEALEAVEKVDPLVIILDLGLKVSDYYEAEGMVALFLEDSGLSPIGLGADPFEASSSGVPTKRFANELVNQIAAPSFLKIGNGGFWWASATEMRRQHEEDNGASDGGWTLDVSTYEVSHCDFSAGACGPGYGNDPGSADVLRAGIEPELAFELTLEHRGNLVEDQGFSIPYDADAWTGTQPDLKDVIQDFPH